MRSIHPLTRYRREQGITQSVLAARLNVEPITVYRWERRLRVPKRSLWPRIKEVTGISAEELVRAAE